MQLHQTCRFCGAQTFDMDSGVRYASRHWAHFNCYLSKGKPLSALPAWMVSRFPRKTLQKYGLENEALRLMAGASCAPQHAQRSKKGTAHKNSR